MVIVALSDIHGNLPALRTAMEEIARLTPDLVVCCGDIASGPLPVETIAYVRGLDVPFVSVRGNADRGAVASFDGTATSETHEDDLWTGQVLGRSERDYLAGLPETLSLTSDELGQLLFCHGSPRRDDDVIVETTPEDDVRPMLEGADANVVVCGNTHMQFDRTVGRHRVVNVGSVGWPYGTPGAYWTILGPTVEFRSTAYDLEAATESILLHSRWPRAEAFCAALMDPPSKEAALRFFTS